MRSLGYFYRYFLLFPALGALVVSALFALAFAARVPAFDAMNEALFDQFQVLQPRPFDADGVVRIVNIDEPSLKEFGQWPWPRTYLSEMVDRIGAAGAAAIAFDIAFAEPDRTSPARARNSWLLYNERFDVGSSEGSSALLEMLSIENLPDHDKLAADTFSRHPVVLGAFLTSFENPGTLRARAGVSSQGSDVRSMLTEFEGAVANIAEISASAAGVGSVSLSPAEGEVVRRVPMLSILDGKVIPAMAVEALRVAQGAGSYVLRATDASGEFDVVSEPEVSSMRVGALVVPLDGDGSIRVKFSGHQPERFVSATEVLAGTQLSPVVANEFIGRIVLIGTSAAGLRDLVGTPIDNVVAGVEVHAEIIEQIVEQDFLTRPDWAWDTEFIVLVIICIISCILQARQSQATALVFALASIGAMFYGSWYSFRELDTLISPVAPALALGSTHLVGTAFSFFDAERSKREITRQFEHFVAPEVIRDIISDPEKQLTPGGDRRELSVLFLDVVDFSTHTETMEPEETVEFLNKLLDPLTEAVLRNQGTVDKYIGDSIMAFWNAPRETPDKENLAIKTAVECLEAVELVNLEYKALGYPSIEICVGINTGYCSVGNIGSTRRLSYSCVGDPVNLAARIEGLTRNYKVPIMVGETTAEAADMFTCIEIDVVAVKGRHQIERVWAVVGDADLGKTEEFFELDYNLGAGRDAYSRQNWDEAEGYFKRCLEIDVVGLFDPAPTAELYLSRVESYRSDPPGELWDGVFTFDRK
ncbi:MAG: adenylate/guanylate cyclase domain-containing protein [Pseudomonadota bacterium]